MMKKLNRYFSIYIALLFLAIQVTASLHMAEHGFEEHSHNGELCDIYVHCQHTPMADTASGEAVAAEVVSSSEPLVLASVAVESFSHGTANPRAPPAL